MSDDMQDLDETTPFDRDLFARWYARQHMACDPGTQVVYYLPAGAPAKEIRLLEVNNLIAERQSDPVEPLDFGVDIGNVDGHRLMVVDVTPSQWEQISRDGNPLPKGWSLAGAVAWERNRHE